MSNEILILYLTFISVLLSGVSVILIPLFKFSWNMDKRVVVLETILTTTKELKDSNNKK